MNPAVPSPGAGWSPGRLRAMILLLFLLQVLGVLYGVRGPRPAVVPARGPSARFETAPAWEPAAGTHPGLTPPTVFTGGRDLAFWDAAERRLPRTGYGLAEWTPPDRWLENPAGRWLPGLPEPPRLPPARRLPPPALAVPAPALPLRTVTELGLGDELARRGLEFSAAAPAGGAGEVSGETVVEVMVDARGTVLSARLAQGCGQRANDEAALAHARGLRFRRWPAVERARELDPSLLSRDRVRYRWASAPAAGPGTAAPAGLR